jgi:hypothetical protein
VSRFLYRLVGAALLDRSVYEGIETDRWALGQALITVLLSSAAAGLGATGWLGPSITTIAGTAGLALVMWMAWAMLMFQIGERVLRVQDTDTNFTELLRTTGFAAAPGILQIFAAFPRVSGFVFAVAWIWMFVAMVVAVRQALDYESTLRALAVCALAILLSGAMAIVVGLVVGLRVE